ncbi:MAG: TonB-like protein [Acidobacteriales bacterium]|nr:TonB-like protein [Terriglobales bacterium]
MASIETPPNIEQPPSSPEQTPRSSASSRSNMTEEDFHFLLSELRDENSRSRWREAIWISIIVHLLVLFTIRSFPKLWPQRQVTLVETPEQLMKDRQLTYLNSPPDTQKLTRKPDNIISDKDRVASSKNPRLNKKLLDQLRDNRRTGASGQQAANAQPQPPAAQQPQGQPNGSQQSQSQPTQQESQTTAQAQPQQKPTFDFRRGAASAGTAVEEAARATARGGGSAGEYGNGLASPNTTNQSNLEILSDTMGVDFAPYLKRVVQSVRINWEPLIPEVARAPLMKQGKVAIEFQIDKDGRVESMHLRGPSGDISLDRAAWGAITGSNPFPPLPREFRGENIALRFHFFYNPDHSRDLQ